MNIYWLNQIPKNQIDFVGGKAKGLAKLFDAGFPVAKGFVAININKATDMNELLAFWKQSGLRNVAVRSSATLEDGVEFSSAGQYDSFLNIKTESAFIKAISDCLDSLNQTTISKYRAFFGQEKSDMNIIVQEMVDAAYAGVAFSNNPLTRKNDVVIETVAGLGEGLVSGAVQAKSHILNRNHPNFENDNLITKQQLETIFNGALEAERVWNIPMDLEWAINHQGNVIWLQARPITTLNDPTIDELNTVYDVKNDVLTNHNVGEMLPGAITPLTTSTVVYAIDYGIRKMLKIVGVVKKIEDVPEEHIICHYYGHLFFNMKYLYRIPQVIIASEKENVDIGICGKVIDIESKDDFPSISIFKRIFNLVKYGIYISSNGRARKKINQISDKLHFDDTSIETMYQSITDNLKYLNQTLTYHYITSAHSGAMSSAIFQILKEDIEDQEIIKGMLASVLEDIEDIESVDILRSLRLVTRIMLKNNPDVINYTSQELLDYVKKAPKEVSDALDKFLTRHGHRCIQESELRSPGWKDNQLGLMTYIKTVLQTKGIEKEKSASKVQDNIENLIKPYKGSKRRALKYLIKQARKGCRNREYSKSRMIYVIDYFKKAYKQLAEMMVEKGALPDADLIYFMTNKELGDLIKEHNPIYIKKSTIRRRLFPEQKRLKFSHVYQGAPQPIALAKENSHSGLKLQGTPLSRGKVVGVARVIESVEDAAKLQPGEIMVAGYTDIGWSPYYAVISGLVTEVGSALSHGAVVAREYALPTVSNINLATVKIQTGDTLSIDGEEGSVLILQTANS